MTQIIANEEASTPSTPGAGKWKLYAKSDGWYALDDAGVEVKVGTAFMGCRLTVTAAPTITTGGSGTAIQWNSENYDTHAMHDNVTNNTRITIPSDGYYSIKAGVTWNPGTGNRRNMGVRIGGATIIDQDEKTPSAGTYTTNNVSTDYYFSAGDYIEIILYQDQGTNLAVAGTGGSCHVEVSKK